MNLIPQARFLFRYRKAHDFWRKAYDIRLVSYEEPLLTNTTKQPAVSPVLMEDLLPSPSLRLKSDVFSLQIEALRLCTTIAWTLLTAFFLTAYTDHTDSLPPPTPLSI